MDRWKISHVLILFSVLTGAGNVVCLGTKFTSLESTGRLLCEQNVSAEEFHRVRWFKSRRDDVFENGVSAVVSWDGSSPPYTSGNYDIDKNFSLVIYNTSILHEGLYRCEITKNTKPYSLEYDVKLIVFALPWKAPLIQRVNQTFNCSVDRVYPLLYPHVEFKHEKYAVQNTDGTYNASVSGSIQDIPSESKAVSCSFPHFNYSQVSSLSLYSTTTVPFENDDEPYTTTHTGSLSPESPIHRGISFTSVLWPIISAAGAAITCFIIGLLLWRKYQKRLQAPVPTKSASAERNGMLKNDLYLDVHP